MSVVAQKGTETNQTALKILLAVVAIMSPLVAAVGAVIDGEQKVRDSNGYLVWVSTADYSSILALTLTSLIVVLALFILLPRASGSGIASSRPIFYLPAAALAAGHLLRGETTESFYAFSATLAIAAVTTSQPNPSTYRGAARVAYISVALALVFALANPQRGTVECRDDKCSPLGTLASGFFAQENVLAIYALAAVSVAFVLPRGEKIFALFVGAAGVLSTGSRTAIAAILVLAALLIVARGIRSPGIARAFAVVVPLITFVASLVLFLAPTIFGSLTGRDFIYALLRERLGSEIIIGPGRGVLLEAFNAQRSSGFLIAHEHGQVPYVLTNGGLFAVVFFAFMLIAIAKSVFHGSDVVLITTLYATPIFIYFLTEPMWQSDPRTPAFLTWLVFALFCSRSGKLIPTDPIRSSRANLRRNFGR